MTFGLLLEIMFPRAGKLELRSLSCSAAELQWRIVATFATFTTFYILGTKYKVGCTLQVGIDQYDSPVFGQVLKICMINGNTSDIMFVVSQLNTIEFSEHYQSFEVKNIQPRRKMVVHQKELSAFLPLNQGKPYGMATTRKYIVQRFDLGTIN